MVGALVNVAENLCFPNKKENIPILAFPEGSVKGLSRSSTAFSVTSLNWLLANNNYTNRKWANRPPLNRTAAVCRLGIVFQPFRRVPQPEINLQDRQATRGLVPAA